MFILPGIRPLVRNQAPDIRRYRPRGRHRDGSISRRWDEVDPCEAARSVCLGDGPPRGRAPVSGGDVRFRVGRRGRTIERDIAEFVAAHYPRLIRLAGLICRDAIDSEDAVQAGPRAGVAPSREPPRSRDASPPGSTASSSGRPSGSVATTARSGNALERILGEHDDIELRLARTEADPGSAVTSRAALRHAFEALPGRATRRRRAAPVPRLLDRGDRRDRRCAARDGPFAAATRAGAAAVPAPRGRVDDAGVRRRPVRARAAAPSCTSGPRRSLRVPARPPR